MKKNILILLIMVLFIPGCATLPKLPVFTEKCSNDQCATFKLMRVNKAELGENRLGNDSMIRLNGKAGIYIPKKWENFRGGFAAGNAYYYFNDDAVFSLPAGTYDIEFLVAVGFESGPRSDLVKGFKAKAGAKYELLVYFINSSRKRSYDRIEITRGLKILKISEVKEFRNNQEYIENRLF
jgi:hypothetical protein